MNLNERLGVLPSLLLGVLLTVIGVYTLDYIVNNWWPFDVTRIDLVRATALGRAEATDMMRAANMEIVMAFLAAVLITVTGVMLPLAFVLNKRFSLFVNDQLNQGMTPRFIVTLRQAIAVGLWVAFCIWLQMNRSLGIAVALLAGVVLILFELMLQIRARAAQAAQLE